MHILNMLLSFQFHNCINSGFSFFYKIEYLFKDGVSILSQKMKFIGQFACCNYSLLINFQSDTRLHL